MNKKIVPVLIFIGIILIISLLYLCYMFLSKNHEDNKDESEPIIVEKESINSLNTDINRGLTQFDRKELNHVYIDNEENIRLTESFEDIITRHVKSFNYFLDQYIDDNNDDKVRDYVHYRVFDRSIKDNDNIKSSPVITIRDISSEDPKTLYVIIDRIDGTYSLKMDMSSLLILDFQKINTLE